jgi:hypothetical protein
MAKVSMKARKEVVGKYMAAYRKASKKEKGGILDVVCGSTGLSRDRAARLLSPCRKTMLRKTPAGKRGRKRVYGDEAAKALRELWVLMDLACGKRLHEGIGDMLDALVRFGEARYGDDLILQLKTMSAATMDRLLKKDKGALRLKGIGTTKPGTLLKREIPIRLGQEWDEAVPGFVEVDLVAHCGWTTAGEYINTLNITDICTGWTEPVAVINKAQRHVFAGLMDVGKRQPFKYLGIDSDNGSEFINHELHRYCKEKGIVFTRSRAYTKNDNCHVEQKNWSLVRRHIGYGRFEGEEALKLLNEYYALLRLHVNFFLPSTKLIDKKRNGAHVCKRYERPLTPYKRILAETGMSEKTKQALEKTFMAINPAQLMRDMMRVKDELEKLRMLD